MATSRGKDRVTAFVASLPGQIQDKLLRGAARVMAEVVADDARYRARSSEVRASIAVETKTVEGGVVAKIQTKGPGAYLAPWEEYGTAPHFISVDESQRNGMSIGRINRLAKEPDSNHSLVIGGNFVGATVMHPGATANPFLRPALDTTESERLAAGQAFINARVTPAGIVGSGDGGGE